MATVKQLQEEIARKTAALDRIETRADALLNTITELRQMIADLRQTATELRQTIAGLERQIRMMQPPPSYPPPDLT